MRRRSDNVSSKLTTDIKSYSAKFFFPWRGGWIQCWWCAIKIFATLNVSTSLNWITSLSNIFVADLEFNASFRAVRRIKTSVIRSVNIPLQLLFHRKPKRYNATENCSLWIKPNLIHLAKHDIQSKQRSGKGYKITLQNNKKATCLP